MELRSFRSGLILLTFIVSCEGQEKSETPIEEKIEKEIDKPNIDSFFFESIAINPSIGPTYISRNLIQDKQGKYWFATFEGIIHYDGNSFTNITNKEELRRYRAFAVLKDKTRNIWFGTIGGGVYMYDGKSYTNITTKDGLVKDKKGDIWFGSLGGVCRYDGITFDYFKHN